MKLPHGNVRSEAFAFELSREIVDSGPLFCELSLGNFRLGTFAYEVLLGASRLGSDAVETVLLRRGDREKSARWSRGESGWLESIL